jgi:L-ascorbate metabolism protein UlaG (beta-lactamase superfamily)
MGRLRHIGGRLKYGAKMVWNSAFAPMAGTQHRPVLVASDEIGVTFIGHSSFLLQMGGKNILVDPVYAKWLILLRRLRRPGVRIKDLPPIDLVLLTHAHMDHLNLPSLRRIVREMRRNYGKAPAVVVPWSNTDLVDKLGFASMQELRWWESKVVAGLTVTLTPCRHWGTRWFTDSHRGFGGYVLQYRDLTLYDSGDTAFFDGFREIGRRFKPQLALLPIGAYAPDSFRTVHTSPEDALQAFVDLGAQAMVPMHYGTFKLSHEPMAEPVPRLLHSAARMGLAEQMQVVPEGETAVFTREMLLQSSDLLEAVGAD